MQCPSCQFQNLPSLTQCGRCGAQLQLNATAIDIHPPRATARTKNWRRNFRTFSRLSSSGHEQLSRLRQEVSRHVDIPDVPPRAILWRMIVPGWPQIYSGNRLRGQLFLLTYLVLLGLSALSYGRFIGNLLLGLVAACHIASVLDVIITGCHDRSSRIFWSLMTFLVVMVLLYVPAWWLIVSVADPQVLRLNAAPFEDGDVVLVNRWSYHSSPPDPGDVVLYNIPPGIVTYAGPNAYAFANNYNVQGIRIDRILAGPGATVTCVNGEIHVNGQLSPWKPLNPLRRPATFQATVPPESYVIFPSTDPYIDVNQYVRFAVVSANQIEGRILMRNQPLSRITFFR